MKKEIAFIIYSDIHHNIWNNFNENDRRIKASIKAEVLIHTKAKQLKSPVLFIGDLLHNEKAISNKLLSYILPHFKRIWSGKTQTYAITGNHDQSEQNTDLSSSPSYINTFSQIFKSLHCIDFKSVAVGDCIVHGIPFLTHDIGLYKSLKKIKKHKTKKNILLLHTTLVGTKDTDGRAIETHTINSKVMKLIKSFDLVICGHIHQPMKLAKNILQVGATNHQRKTDKDSDLGYWIIYNDLSTKFVELPLPKFVELEYGSDKPDNKNYYYNKEKVSAQQKAEVSQSDNFNDISNKRKISKAYLKEKGIKDKNKKVALIKVLKETEE